MYLVGAPAAIDRRVNEPFGPDPRALLGLSNVSDLGTSSGPKRQENHMDSWIR